MDAVGKPLIVPSTRKRKTSVSASLPEKNRNTQIAPITPNARKVQKEKSAWRQIGSLQYKVQFVEAQPDCSKLYMLADASYDMINTETKGKRQRLTPRRNLKVLHVFREEAADSNSGRPRGTTESSVMEPLVEQPQPVTVREPLVGEPPKARRRRRNKGAGFAESDILSTVNSNSGRQKGNAESSDREPLVEMSQPIWPIPLANPNNAAIGVKLKALGISFYKRIGQWTVHLWGEKKEKKQAGNKKRKAQAYLGSFATATEAMRAYDRASLKLFGNAAKLNKERNDYLLDILKMKRMSYYKYKQFLKESSKTSQRNIVAPGVTKCPEGWFEVIGRGSAPPKDYKFLGRFDKLEDANRCCRRAVSGKI